MEGKQITKEESGIQKLQEKVKSLDIEVKILRNKLETTKEKKKKEEKPKKVSKHRIYKIDNSEIYNFAKNQEGQNVVTRQLQQTAEQLDKFSKTAKLTTKAKKFNRKEFGICYGCGKICTSFHPVYVYSCPECGKMFQENRTLTRDLTGKISLVVGCRTKLGHQVTLKLLRANSIVIGTTRYPQETRQLFAKYEDYENFKDNLILYEKPFDLDNENVEAMFEELKTFIEEKYGKLNNLVFCAAQTIRVREKEREKNLNEIKETNRYGDAKFVKETNVNSWQMRLEDLNQKEMEECSRINAIAPALLVKTLLPVLKKSEDKPFIIFVHAKEGLFDVHKSPFHIHTNMAKCALHMLTVGLIQSRFQTENGCNFSIHGCDPGWISVDEYYEDDRPWDVPPLDEIDGASRILYPIWKDLESCHKTRRHFIFFSY